MKKIFFITLAMLGCITQANAYDTLFDENNVIYYVKDPVAHTLIVSDANASLFSDPGTDIVIPRYVTDASTAGDASIRWEVVEMSQKAFFRSGIRSVKIEAPIATIPQSAFDECPELTSVELNAEVTAIAKWGFAACPKLTSITGIEGLREIGIEAFLDDTSLDAIVLGENLTSISNKAFKGCSALATISLPNSVTSMGTAIFYGCTGLESAVVGNGITTIPSETFSGCTALTDVTIPEGIEKIDASCFYKCTNLRFPQMPQSIKYIMGYAFSYCKNLGVVTLPQTLQKFNSEISRFSNSGITEIVWPEEACYVASYDFQNTETISEVTIPGWLTSIPLQLFINSADLEKVTIEEGVETIESSTFKDCKRLSTLTLPESLETIKSSAFQNDTALTDFAFPSSMAAIEGMAFYGCSGLQDLVLPARASLGSQSFKNTELSTITFPSEPMGDFSTTCFDTQKLVESITIPGWMTTVPALFSSWNLKQVILEEGVTELSASCFYNNGNLTDVTWPATTLRTINSSAFSNCSLANVTSLPQGLETIGNSAFLKNKMSTLTIPNSVSTVEASAFSYAYQLSTVVFESGNLNLKELGDNAFSYDNNAKLSEIVLPDHLERIGKGCFVKCLLTKIDFPPTLKYVGQSAFASAWLTEVNLQSGVHYDDLAFSNCDDIEVINFPDEECTFGVNVFQNMTLKHIDFPEWMTEIPEKFCYQWTQLETLTFGSAVTKIGTSAFYGCIKLHDVPWPITLREIGKQAFYNCYSSTPPFGKVTISYDVNIGEEAFYKASITEIEFLGCPTIGTNAFYGMTRIEKITFPSCMGTIPAGFCNNWSSLKEVTLPVGIKHISDNAFNNCKQLTTFNLPEGLISIGASAFENCTGLTSVTFPESLESVGSSAYKSSGIAEINWSPTLMTIGSSCFYNTQVTSVCIPAYMADIPAQAFENCYKLEHLTWEPHTGEEASATVTIGSEAFAISVNNPYKSTLWDIHMPPVPTTLKDYAFRYCRAAETIHFENVDVTFDGITAFGYCYGLKYLTFPPAMSEIGEYAFTYCSSLERIDWEPRTGNDAAPYVTIKKNAFTSSALQIANMPPVPTTIQDNAFSSCKSLTEINFENVEVEWGTYCFQECSSLESVTIPDAITYIATGTFRNCSKLAYVDMGSGVTLIKSGAFSNAGLKEIKWSPALTDVESQAFTGCTLEHLQWPATVDYIPTMCFQGCEELESVVIPDNVTIIKSSSAFSGCTALKTVDLGHGIETIGDASFSGDTSLTHIDFPESLTWIGHRAFQDTGLEEVTIPATLKPSYAFNGGNTGAQQAFENCKHLKRVINECPNLGHYQTGMFSGCDSLVEVISDVPFTYISSQMFQNCKQLKRFVIPNKVGGVNNYGLANCESLEEFPYLGDSYLGVYAFQNCKSLKEITMPYAGNTYSSTTGITGLFDGCTSLQSITWPSSGKYFYLQPNMINNVPLEAVSYCYATDITPYGESYATIQPCKDPTATTLAKPAKSKLMVMRGERWKFIEAGYNKLFDIEEMKAPQVDLEGDIQSKFNVADNTNRYFAVIRWDMPLSDLNANEPTTIKIYRDRDPEDTDPTPVATVTLSAPSAEVDVDTFTDDAYRPARNLTTNGKVIAVEVTNSSSDQNFKGLIDYPVTDKYGNVTYKQVIAFQSPRVYYDAVSHKRLVNFDYYGYNSWMTVYDEFDSPDLQSGKVPMSYVYSAEMTDYSYTVPVNNADMEINTDTGLRYYYKERSTANEMSEDVTMYTGISIPTINSEGMYTFDEIQDDVDIDRPLNPTERFDDTTYEYSISYKFNNEQLMAQKGTTTQGKSVNMYSYLTLVELTADNDTIHLSTKAFKGSTDGVVYLPVPGSQNMASPTKRYQVISHSDLRGVFGSPIIEIPDAPQLKLSIDTKDLAHEAVFAPTDKYVPSTPNHYHIHLKIEPDVRDMGYRDGKKLGSEDYHVGLWRRFTDLPWSRDDMMLRSVASPEVEMVHHTQGRVTETNVESCDKDDCDYTTGVEHPDTESTDTAVGYSDAFAVPFGHLYQLNYDNRLYVKVPSTMNPGEDRYMIAAASTGNEDRVTEVETVTDEPSDTAIYFDLQGIRIEHPAAGHIYILVTPTETRKVIYVEK